MRGQERSTWQDESSKESCDNILERRKRMIKLHRRRRIEKQGQEDQLYSKFDKKEEEMKNEDERDGGNVW